MNKNKGFTLIELLVVIAIIGILASVVLASLNSARDKGKDAAVKSQLASMKAQAELFYATGETYAGVCSGASGSNGFGGDTGPGLLKAAKDSNSIDVGTVVVDNTTPGDYSKITCHSVEDAWVVEAPLTNSTSSSRNMFCVDSTGKSTTTTGATQVLANIPAVSGSGPNTIGVSCL